MMSGRRSRARRPLFNRQAGYPFDAAAYPRGSRFSSSVGRRYLMDTATPGFSRCRVGLIVYLMGSGEGNASGACLRNDCSYSGWSCDWCLCVPVAVGARGEVLERSVGLQLQLESSFWMWYVCRRSVDLGTKQKLQAPTTRSRSTDVYTPAWP